MDSVQWIALGSVVTGFVVGYLLGRWNGRSDCVDEVGVHIHALRAIGHGTAKIDPENKVPWPMIDRELRKFPGEKP